MSDKQISKGSFAGIDLKENKELDLTQFDGKTESLEKLQESYSNPVAINKPAENLASPGMAYTRKDDNKLKLNETLEIVKGFMPPAYEADVVTQLLNHKRTMHRDSPEMGRVKEKVRTAKEAMDSAEEKVYTAKEVGAMIVKFDEAVKACND